MPPEDDPDGAASKTRVARRAVTLTGLTVAQAEAALRAVGVAGAVVALESSTAVLLADVPAGVAVAAFCSGLVRQQPATVLWLDEEIEADEAAGLVVLMNADVVTAHSWVPSGDHDEGDAASMAATLGVRDARVALQALMRRHGDPRQLLADAVELLRLPPESVGLLLRGDDVGAVHVDVAKRRGRYRAARHAARLVPLPRPLAWAERFQWILPGAIAAMFFARSGLAALDDAGRRADDVIGFSVLGSAGCLATALAVRRSRRSTRREATLQQEVAGKRAV